MYQIFRNNTVTRDGGVAFYIRDDLKCQIINTSNDIEQLFLPLNVNNESYVIGVFYRSPRTNYKYFIDHLEKSLNTTMQDTEHIFVLKDINIRQSFCKLLVIHDVFFRNKTNY